MKPYTLKWWLALKMHATAEWAWASDDDFEYMQKMSRLMNFIDNRIIQKYGEKDD
jgi:hypothetical protein